jgi:hypothetical protein
MKRSAQGFFVALSAVVALGGCGRAASTAGTATATVAFDNVTARTRLAEQGPLGLFDGFVRELTRAKPTVFQMKLIAAYITADIDSVTQNNVGATSMVYLNPDCADDIMHCDISAGTAEDNTPMSHIVTSYFDFGGTSAAVNAALNAQGRTVEAGSYKYARLEFCKLNSANANNIKWADGTTVPTGSPQEFKRNSCTVNSVEIVPPITIADGGTATVSIAYDLTNSISGGTSCDDSSGAVCFTMPSFIPSAL